MKLFGWKSAGRASARPALGRAFGAYSTGDWPRAYEQQVRDGYVSNPVAQRAVRLVAEGVATAPVVASDPVALALINATSGGQVLIETVAAYLLLHGNAYVEILAGPDGAPAELFALRPERMTVEADARGWPMAFLYRAGDAVTRLPANQVIHIRTHHPLDDHYGLGCLGAASGAVAIHNVATRWNKALLDNAARPSGALVYDPGDAGATLSGEQFDKLRAEMEASFSGAGNAGRPMLLEGGLKWQAMSLSPADMDFVGLKAAAAREIALAFGVPPMLLGLPGDATYANYREANRALWRSAILPLAGKILAALSEGLRPWFAGLSLSVDLDRVGALSEERERLWAQVGGADFMTVNEKRAAVGLDPLDLEEVEEEPDTESGVVGESDPETDVPEDGAPTETKFNPWHDPDDGQFTFAGSGVRYGGGGAIEGVVANMAKRHKQREERVGRGQAGVSKRPSTTPAQTQIGPIPGYHETGTTAWRKDNDQVFLDAANAFNRRHKLTPDNPRYMHAINLKAQAMIESGGEGDKEAFLRDPLQVNNPKDWAPEKANIGLTGKSQVMTPATSAAAALEWLDMKGHRTSILTNGKLDRSYVSKAYALKKYNGRSALRSDGHVHSDWYSTQIIRLGQQAASEYNRKRKAKRKTGP